MKTRTQQVVCWVEPLFDLIDVTAFCHVLSAAGSNWNWRPYRISMASRVGGMITSSAQVSVQTIPLAACGPPDIVILGCGDGGVSLDINEDPFTMWRQSKPLWVALGNSSATLLRLGLPVSSLAVSAMRQPEVRKWSSSVEFTTKDFHFEADVLSCSTLDVVPAAFALLERQIGRSARRYVETQMGLTHNPIDLRGLTKLGP